MHHRRLCARLALLGMLIMAMPPASSLPEDRNQPILLEADRAEWDQKTGTSTYEGNVIITQGTMRLTADNATIYTEQGRFQRIEAVGSPATVQYQPDPDQEVVHGTSRNVEYDALKNLVKMTTDAVVSQGEDKFSGDYIEYDLNADVVRARGEEGSRIQITIQPDSQTITP